ncbi:MAG: hypothetical protein K0R34_1903 [Herbinix sp.]|jgi:hypothetical protein|nr:hypothetical protein [Herbinix sp.]
MPVGPIEVIRAQEATQIRHMDTQRAQHAQEQLSRNFQNTVRQDQSKPTQTTKSDNTDYRYDAKEKGNNQYKGSGSKQKKKEEVGSDSKNGKNTPKSGGIDILI